MRCSKSSVIENAADEICSWRVLLSLTRSRTLGTPVGCKILVMLATAAADHSITGPISGSLGQTLRSPHSMGATRTSLARNIEADI